MSFFILPLLSALDWYHLSGRYQDLGLITRAIWKKAMYQSIIIVSVVLSIPFSSFYVNIPQTERYSEWNNSYGQDIKPMQLQGIFFKKKFSIYSYLFKLTFIQFIETRTGIFFFCLQQSFKNWSLLWGQSYI